MLPLMLRVIAILPAAAVLLGAASCGTNKPTAPPDIATTIFAPSLGVDLASATMAGSGLYYQDLQVGDGAVARGGSRVSVHYTGWLVDGTRFDSSIDGGQPIAFTLGARQVIAGWDEGIRGMRVGGTRKLIIPPSLGYGSRATGPIPANSILVFDVTLVRAQ